MNEGTKKLAFAAVPAIAILLLLAAGAAIAYQMLLGGARRTILRHREAATMAGVADADALRKMALAYDDPAAAAREIGGYAWEVPNVPTPFVGAAPEPGVHGGATINAMQFRASEELVLPKPPGTFRIFVTGGSTAFGAGAPSDDRTISGYLAAVLARELAPRTGLRYEVWNAANPAWTSTHERILIENRLSNLEPDLVVSLSGNNEAHWGYLGHDALWMRSYADTLFFRLLSIVRRDVGLGEFPDVAKAGERVPPETVAARLAKNLRLSAAALGPVPYVFALQPTLAAARKRLSPREEAFSREREAEEPGRAAYFRDCYAAIEGAFPELESAGVRAVDLTGVFDADGPETEIFLDSYHFGDRGNRRIAEALFAALRPTLPE